MTKEQRTKIVKYLEQTLRKMRGLFSNTYIQSIAEMKDAIEAGADFKWEDFKAQSLKIDKMIESLLNKSGLLIHNAVQNTYQIGVENAVLDIREKYENLKKKYTRKKDFRELDTDATSIIRSGAQDKQRKGEQLDNLSDRVWNLQDQVKDNITIIIKNAIAQGDSPKQAQSSVVKYLQNPKLITMHVYDKDGNLTLSEEAKNLHPGRGVYRDPLKNAERLLRTEMMAAYRKAEIEQYQKTDLIIGYEIKLSGNHTTLNGMRKPIKLKDICDTLQGKYPKTFIWHGWHPNCRCVLLPLYVSDDKMESYFDAKHSGTLDEWNKKNQISVLPNNFNDWVQENSQRLNLAQNAKKTALPQWVEDNKEVKQLAKENEEKLTPEERRKRTLDNAKKRHDSRSEKEIADIISRWNNHKDNIKIKKEAEYALENGFYSVYDKNLEDELKKAIQNNDFDSMKKLSDKIEAINRDEVFKRKEERESRKVNYVGFNNDNISKAESLDVESLSEKVNKIYSELIKNENVDKSKLEYKVYNNEPRNEVTMKIENKNIKISQTFSTERGKKICKLDLFKIENTDLQGKGFSKNIMKELFENWKQQGIQRVVLDAVSGKDMNGAYTWARYGFMTESAGRLAQVVPYGSKYYNFIAEYVEKKLDGRWGKPFDVNLLIDKFGKEEVNEYFKEYCISWSGYLDLNDEEQVKNFIDYCG